MAKNIDKARQEHQLSHDVINEDHRKMSTQIVDQFDPLIKILETIKTNLENHRKNLEIQKLIVAIDEASPPGSSNIVFFQNPRKGATEAFIQVLKNAQNAKGNKRIPLTEEEILSVIPVSTSLQARVKDILKTAINEYGPEVHSQVNQQ